SGGGTLAPQLIQNVPAAATTVALGNLDKDRLPDVAFGITPSAGQPGQVRVILNQSGKVVPAVTWDTANYIQVTTASGPTALAVVDYDGDGTNDVVYSAADGVHVLINTLDAMGRPQLGDFLVYHAPS